MAFTTSDPEGGAGELWIASDDLSIRRQLTTGPQQFHGIAWLPDSRHVVYGARGDEAFRVWRVPIDGGPAVAMTGGVGSSSSPTVAPDGRTLLFSHVVPSRNLVHAPGVEGALLPRSPRSGTTRGRSSRRMAVAWRRSYRRRDSTRLYITRLGNENAGARERQAGRPPGVARSRRTWPTSVRRLLTVPKIRVADLTTGANETWCRLDGRASWLAVSPDRRRIAAVILGPNGRQSVTVRDLRARRDVVLADGGEYEHLRWVPGRARLSWSGPAKSVGRETDGIWVRDVEGSPVVRVVPDGYSPVWAEDGASVYYSRIGDHAGLWRFDLGKPAPVRLRQWTEVDYFDVRDGHLVFARIRSNTRIFRLPLS